MPSVLVLAASKAISAQELTALPSLGDVPLADVTVATSSGTLAGCDLAGARFDCAVSTGPAGHHTVSLLGAVAAALAPGGRLVVHEADAAPSFDALKKTLTLSGFINPRPLDAAPGCLAADKPAWETGARAAITLKPKAAAAKTWTLDADDDELVEEDELLTEEDLARPAPAAGGDDCESGPGGKKACDNCTCGRADGEERKLTRDMIENPTSGCGSCALGDAFRCGGCPYRGLPAFEMGKKIELPADFMLEDI